MSGQWMLRRPRVAASLAGLAVAAVVAASLVAVAQPASAAYPTNLPPGYTSVPFAMQTFTWSQAGTFSNGTPGLRCYVGVVLTFDGDFYGDPWRPTRPDVRGPFRVQGPTGTPPVLNEAASVNDADAYDVITPDLFADPFRTWFASYSTNVPGHGIPVRGAGGMAQAEDGCSAYYAQAAEVVAHPELYAVWTPKFLPRHDPVADFDYQVTDAGTNTVAFTNLSNDAEDGSNLTSAWNFGDGATSTSPNPTHSFSEGGTHSVSLTVTDSQGDRSTVVKEVELTTGLVVNSTGDASAEDPEDGCDTGATIGEAPECTLRAAIEAANDAGGGVITFDIAGGGVPSIAATSPLPTIIGPTTIDGTTQAGGWVEVVGTGVHVLQLQGGPSLVTGLVVRGGALQIHVTGGTGQVVRGNRIGTNAAGSAGDAGSASGIRVSGGDGARIEDNVIGTAEYGIGLASGSTASTVDGNRIGVSDDGAAAMGDTEVGVIVTAPNATISDNTIQGTSVGIELLRATATDAKVIDNAVGTRHDGTAAFDGQAYGIRSDGAPGATITGNRVAATNAIVLAGSDQSTTESDGIHLEPVSTEPIDGAATGAKATVADNDIGLLANGTNAGTTAYGIATWAGMADTTIDGNRIGATQATAIRLLGGSRHTLTRNTIGGDPDEGTPTPVHDGIVVNGSTDVTIGGVGGAGNAIVHTDDGIDATETASGLRIEANRVAAANAEAEGAGIEVGDGAPGAVITSNRIVGGSAGIASEAPSAKITGNHLLAQSDVGIEAAGDGVNVSGNVVAAGSDGVRVGGNGSTVTQNRIGLENGSDTVTGNGGVGLAIEGGKVVVSKNVIAGTGAEGIKVNAGAKATLRSNRVWETNGEAIDVASGPDAPDLAAAVRSGSGEDTRTTLLLKDLPEGDAGTIEVFANSNCASSEAQFLMDINRTKTATETARIIQIKGASTRDHFTVTYTDRDGNTSELSGCVDAGTYPDGDGDGSIDVFDEFVHAAGNPSAGVYATDNEKLMLALVSPFDGKTGRGGGEIDRLGFINDPAPGSHPTGWTAPYGIMSFRIRNLQPGARTNIAFAIIDPSDPFPANTGYWKYGPETSGAAPTWWDFAYDDASGTGVRVTDGVDLPGIGITRVLSLALADGGRGDSDGGANGTITDPGGPVLGARPETPTTITIPMTTTSTATSVAAATTIGPTATTIPTTATKPASLSTTGTDPSTLITAGLCALALGFMLIAVARRRWARW